MRLSEVPSHPSVRNLFRDIVPESSESIPVQRTLVELAERNEDIRGLLSETGASNLKALEELRGPITMSNIAVDRLFAEACRLQHPLLREEHILLAFLHDDSPNGGRAVFRGLGVKHEELQRLVYSRLIADDERTATKGTARRGAFEIWERTISRIAGRNIQPGNLVIAVCGLTLLAWLAMRAGKRRGGVVECPG